MNKRFHCAAIVLSLALCSGRRSMPPQDDIWQQGATMPQRALVQTSVRRKTAAPAAAEARATRAPASGLVEVRADDISPRVYPGGILMAGPSPSAPNFEWQQQHPDPYNPLQEQQLLTNAPTNAPYASSPASVETDDSDLAVQTDPTDAAIMDADTASQSEATDYVSSGCHQLPLDASASYTLHMGMSVSKCFHFCSRRAGFKFFGLTRGNECFCLGFHPGSTVAARRCDIKCTGDPKMHCGGLSNIASIFTMIDCAPTTQGELDRRWEKKKAKLVASYQTVEGESCGQSRDGRAELDGSDVKPGSPEDCAVACWEAKGAENCAGFTYDEMLQKCTFHADVIEGDVIKKKGLSCYYKKLQIDL